jgi:hypothetical protein
MGGLADLVFAFLTGLGISQNQSRFLNFTAVEIRRDLHEAGSIPAPDWTIQE